MPNTILYSVLHSALLVFALGCKTRIQHMYAPVLTDGHTPNLDHNDNKYYDTPFVKRVQLPVSVYCSNK